MSALLLQSHLVMPLLQGVVVRAVRTEVFLELGQIPVRAGNEPAAVIVVDARARAGRGRWTPGFWWPDEAAPRWADEERPLRDDRVALPVHADHDGTERYVRVMVRLRPLGVACQAEMVFGADALFPT